MTAALFRQTMDALCNGIQWSAADAAGMLTNLDGQSPRRETVRDWLTRDAVPPWVWPQLVGRALAQQAALRRVLRAVKRSCLHPVDDRHPP